MSTTKLTLSADPELVRRAKKLAARKGTSLSSLFARFLTLLIEGDAPPKRLGPVTKAATGLVRLPKGKSDKQLLEEALADRHSA